LDISGDLTTIYNVSGMNSIIALTGDTVVLDNVKMKKSSFMTIQNQVGKQFMIKNCEFEPFATGFYASSIL